MARFDLGNNPWAKEKIGSAGTMNGEWGNWTQEGNFGVFTADPGANPNSQPQPSGGPVQMQQGGPLSGGGSDAYAQAEQNQQNQMNNQTAFDFQPENPSSLQAENMPANTMGSPATPASTPPVGMGGQGQAPPSMQQNMENFGGWLCSTPQA